MPANIKIRATDLWGWDTHWATVDVIHPLSNNFSQTPWKMGELYTGNPMAQGKDCLRITLTGPRRGKRGNAVFTKEQVQELISALSVMAQQL